MLKSSGGWRRIHHLSFPKANSVNAFIPTDWGAPEYTSFDEVIEVQLQQGPGAVLLKEVLADAFRHMPAAICDRWLLGFQWLEIFYMEAFLPFGLRTAPFLFDLFAKALHFILAYVLGWHIVLNYLDDFFTIFPPGTDPKPRMAEWQALCERLGLHTNSKKEESGTSLDFLGIELDPVAMEARLPIEKLVRARALVTNALSLQHLLRHDLEELVGFLAFCAKVVVPGRCFSL